MQTSELEKLTLDAAKDMEFLLSGGGALAEWTERDGGATCLWHRDGRWQTAFISAIPINLAISALIEFWRNRLEKEHGVWIDSIPRQEGVRFLPRNCRSTDPLSESWSTFPEAIVAAVRALAKEKREKAIPRCPRCGEQLSPASACPVCFFGTKPNADHTALVPSPAAMRAARRLVGVQGTRVQQAAAIIDEELNRKD
jgi:hypothetical protein